MKKLPTFTALLISAAFVGCGEKESTETTINTETNPTIDSIMVDSAPAEAKVSSVVEARQSYQPGTEQTVFGRVGGVMEPFSAEYATMTILDDKIQTCERLHGDGCPTPWDACCAGAEDLSESRMNVQIVGDDGRPLATGLKGVNNLAELDGVIVTGTVAEGSSAENLILNATSIYRKPAEKKTES